MSTHEQNPELLTKSCRAISEGNWEELKYKVIDANRMRKFIKIITIYGNFVRCKQECLDDIEDNLTKYKSFADFKKANPDIVFYAMARGFAYLFASLTISNIPISEDSCPRVYVKTDVKEEKSTVVPGNDLAYSAMEEVD